MRRRTSVCVVDEEVVSRPDGGLVLRLTTLSPSDGRLAAGVERPVDFLVLAPFVELLESLVKGRKRLVVA